MFGTEVLDSIATNKKYVPSSIDSIYYLFWDKGISLEEFEKLPLPYIFTILNVHNYIKEKEKEELDKAKRKG